MSFEIDDPPELTEKQILLCIEDRKREHISDHIRKLYDKTNLSRLVFHGAYLIRKDYPDWDTQVMYVKEFEEQRSKACRDEQIDELRAVNNYIIRNIYPPIPKYIESRLKWMETL